MLSGCVVWDCRLTVLVEALADVSPDACTENKDNDVDETVAVPLMGALDDAVDCITVIEVLQQICN